MRPISLDDVDELVTLDSDPEVMQYLNGGRATPVDEVAERIRHQIGRRWMAYEGATVEFVGWFGLNRSGVDAYEVGYRLRRRAWGRGLATEGTRALINAAFRQLGAQRVCAQTMAVNTRSRRMMERCSMKHVRTFHRTWDHPIAGTELGEVEYELLRSDWESLSAAPPGKSPLPPSPI
jgi:RimJ/RimL family protein N-acetyltransferase